MAKRQSTENAPAPSFEEALVELQSIVGDLEDGTLGLEASLGRFERGIGLLKTCYSILESAEAKVELLTRFNGNAPPQTVAFEYSATFTTTESEPPTVAPPSKAESGKPSLF